MTYPAHPSGPQQPAQPPPWSSTQETSAGYPPEQPRAPYPPPPDQAATQAPKRRRAGLIIAAVVGALLIIAGGGVGAFALRGTTPFKDSGVAMCEQMRDAQVKDVQAMINGSKWNIDTYHTIRQQFVDSRYADLRDAGTKLIDLAWQIFGSTNSTDSIGAALVAGGQIMQDYSSLTGACANHGVDIPN